jgi:hypothetical protein
MDTVVYSTIPAILEAQSTTQARIDMLNTILNGMETAILRATTTGQFEEYSLDTGQTKNSVRYRNITELQQAYNGLLKTQDMLYARINNNRIGRVVRLVPNQNFIGRGWYGCY